MTTGLWLLGGLPAASLSLVTLMLALAAPGAAAAPATVERYAKWELTLRTEPVAGNPFDPAENEVRLVVTGPRGLKLTLPAFYDGDDTWRVRFTPTVVGRYRYEAEAGGKARLREPVSGAFRVTSSRRDGFVRIDRRSPWRFTFDSGRPFFPVGHNVAWTSRWQPDHVEYDQFFAEMGKVGENWARVWMSAWGGLNLEWTEGKLGWYDLEAARYLDRVIGLAEQHGVYVQLVLQHHGQFSTRVNPNWADNPYSAAKGGFLEQPGGFFTEPRARDLFRQRARYILARWGYSPHILAWELWNEVQFTDHPGWDAVARWHDEMAAHLRAHDPYKHLITTSNPPPDSPVWKSMDYLQAHAYHNEPMVAAGAGRPSEEPRKPFFTGEWGGAGGSGPREDPASFVRRGVWAGLFAGASGAPMFWDWEYVHRHRLYPVFGAVARFVSLSGLNRRADLRPAAVPVESDDLGPLSLSPALGWESTRKAEFSIGRESGALIEGLPSFIQGRSHRDMMPVPVLVLDAASPTKLTVTVSQVARAGAEMVLLLDGKEVARRPFPAAESDTRSPFEVTIDVPAGRSRVTLGNEGEDWYNVSSITLSQWAPRLQARGLSARDLALLWARNAEPSRGPVGGVLRIPGLRDGRYRVERVDTATGETTAAGEVSSKGGTAELQVTALTSDTAYVLRPAR